MATIIIKKGDTVSALAKQYGMTLQQFKDLNPQITDLNKIYVGQTFNTTDSAKTAGTGEAIQPPSNILTDDMTHAFAPNEWNLIKFTTDPTKDDPATNESTLWLLDASTKQMRPFLNAEAFNNWSKINWDGSTAQDAVNLGKVHIAPASLLLPGKMFGEIQVLPTNQGVQINGSAPATDTVDTQSVQNRYGQELNQQAEDNTMNFLFGTGGNGGWIKSMQNDGISPTTIKSISEDPALLHFYTHALTYGGYQPTDVFLDAKRRDAVNAGNTALTGIKVIDEAKTRDQYYATPQGDAITSNPALTLPATLSGISTNNWNYTLNNLPKEAFDTIVKPFDWNSAEGKDLMSKVKTSFYDIMEKQLNAVTEADKATADYQYKQLQEAMSRNYGIQLSDNATAAWNQLGQIESGFSTRGLAGSGMAEEGVDKYLSSVRKADERVRTNQATEEEQKKFEYYKNSATPEQIAALSEQEKIDWGFKPGADTLSFYDMANLKSKFPDVPEERLKAYRDSILDENGNYRSVLYKNMFANKLQLAQDKEAYQMGEVQYDSSGNITGGYGAVFQKALEEQNARRYLNLDPTYYGPNSKLDANGNPVVADASKADAALAAKNTGTGTTGTGTTGTTLKEGEPITLGSVKTPTQIPKAATPYTPPAGYEAIGSPDLIPNYQPNNTISNQGTLYGIPKVPATNTNQLAQDAAKKAAEAAAKVNNPLTTSPYTAPTPTTPITPARTGYQGSSIVDYLNSIGQNSSQAARANLAKQQGISNYNYSAQQNTQLLKSLRGY